MTASALRARTSGAAPQLEDTERFLLDALGTAKADRPILVVRVPAPMSPVTALAAGLRRGTSVLWRPPSGASIAGHGATATVSLSGPDRIAALESAAQEIFEATQRLCHPAVPDAAPRLFGGWSFAPHSADDTPWEGFGDGRFFLPRWSYERHATSACLSLALDLGRGGIPTARVRTELREMWRLLTRPLPAVRPAGPLETVHGPKDAWRAQIDAITAAIRSGRFEKLVAARRTTVFGQQDLEPWACTRALARRYPDTWCFALRFGAGTFVGATPERLFVKRGLSVETDALAGSIAADATPLATGLDDLDAAAMLRASLKDRREHRPVVEHLLERLGPLCTHLAEPSEPRVRRLPNVLHLHTTIRGALEPAVSAARLASALHPTPAVGGVPSRAATEWIEAAETHPRGWYAGPVGWLDADGDAELTVALRCGVIRGNTAWAWAGGGIVEGSEAEAEYRESGWKLEPFLSCLDAT